MNLRIHDYIRSRWMLFAALTTLLLARVALDVCWFSRVVVDGKIDEPRVVLFSTALWRTRIETWDWTTGERKVLATNAEPVTMVMEWYPLKTREHVYWLSRDMLHEVALAPPHERRVWTILYPENGDPQLPPRLVGVSRDGRFAVIEHFVKEGGGFVWENRNVTVFDLDSRSVVRSSVWNGTLSRGGAEGEFHFKATANHSQTMSQPVAAYWGLTATGVWLPIGGWPGEPAPGDSIDLAMTEAGEYRQLKTNSYVNVDETAESGWIVDSTPARATFTSNYDSHPELLLSTNESDQLTRTGVLLHSSKPTAVTDDGRIVAATDCYHDGYVLDASTGKAIAVDRSGSWRRRVNLVWVLAASGVAIAWFRHAWRQTQFTAMAYEAAMFALCCQGAAIGCLTGVVVFSGEPDLGLSFALLAVVAPTIGFGIAVGWYWAFGRAPLGVKLLWGLVGMIVANAPLSLAASLASTLSYVPLALVAPAFGSLSFACGTALLLLPLSLLGWTVGEGPTTTDRRRFGIASLMALTAAIAVVMASFKANFLPDDGAMFGTTAKLLLPPAVFGIALPAVWMWNTGRAWRIAAWSGLVRPQRKITSGSCGSIMDSRAAFSRRCLRCNGIPRLSKGK